MAGVSIKVDDRAVIEALKELAQRTASIEPAMREIGERLLNSTRQRFAEGRDPEGNAWAPLSPKYRERKEKNNGKVLVLESYLKDLLRYQTFGGLVASVELGTDRVYGATHQFGDPRRNIPARPFLGLSEADRRVVVEVLNKHLARALGK